MNRCAVKDLCGNLNDYFEKELDLNCSGRDVRDFLHTKFDDWFCVANEQFDRNLTSTVLGENLSAFLHKDFVTGSL